MSSQEHAASHAPTAEEVLIIAQADQGFRVYSPSAPRKHFRVTGLSDNPSCTCPEFRAHGNETGWCCSHITAVVNRMGALAHPTPQGDGQESAVGAAATLPAEMAGPKRRTPKRQPPAQLVLKRSVSPDGRIDSLSVEIATAIDRFSPSELSEKATGLLGLEDAIADIFLKVHQVGEKPNGQQKTPTAPRPEGRTHGRILGIGGMNGKFGRRMFLNIDVNGEVMRFFGSRTQLSDVLSGNGYQCEPSALTEGMELSIPVHVTTKPSADGRYINIDQVLPRTGQPVAERTSS